MRHGVSIIRYNAKTLEIEDVIWAVGLERYPGFEVGSQLGNATNTPQHCNETICVVLKMVKQHESHTRCHDYFLCSIMGPIRITTHICPETPSDYVSILHLPKAWPRLTQRECDVISMVHATTNPMIAARLLQMSYSTLRSHIQAIMNKIGLDGTAEFWRFIERYGC